MSLQRRIALLCSFNLDLLNRPLGEALARSGIDAELYFTGYGLWEPEALDSQSALNRFAPEVVILFIDAADLLPPLSPENSLPQHADAVASGRDAWRRVETVINALLSGLSPQTTLLVHNLARPNLNALGTLEDNSGYSSGAAVDEFNARLRTLAERNQRVKAIDYAGFVSYHGQQALLDDRLWYLGRMRLGRAGLGHLAALHSRYLSALLLPRSKCLVLDLDNTLLAACWGKTASRELHLARKALAWRFASFNWP